MRDDEGTAPATVARGAGRAVQEWPVQCVPALPGTPPRVLHDTWAGLVAIDACCRIILFNPEAERISGRRAPEVLGRRFCQALWPMGCSAGTGTTAARPGCPWQHAIAGHERRRHPREVSTRCGDRRIDLLLGARTTIMDHGRPGALITFIDLTQRRELERVRNDLVADVFHTLRTPICAISLAAHGLASTDDRVEVEPEGLHSMLAALQHHASQLLQELNDLLNRTTFAVDTPRIIPRAVTLDPIIAEVIAKLEPLLAARGQRVRVVQAALPAVLADERRIEQVLMNLLANANTYSVAGDEIVVTVDVRDHAVRVSVEDHGPGVPAPDRAHVFERFYRAAETAATTAGAGLGLAIVRSIVEAHHGHVGVEDVTPSGARFWFTLPQAAGQ